MELRSILGSGVVRFVEVAEDSNPVLAQDIVQAIVERYRFWTFPTQPSEFNLDDASSGAEFEGGIFDGASIQRLRLFRRGVSAETQQISSEKLDEFVADLLAFGASKFGVKFRAASPVTSAYNSNLEVSVSDDVVRRLNALTRVGEMIDGALGQYGFQDTQFSFGALVLQPDDGAGPLVPTRFSFERRANYPIKDNVFFSQAPLPTAEHIRVLQELERSLTD